MKAKAILSGFSPLFTVVLVLVITSAVLTSCEQAEPLQTPPPVYIEAGMWEQPIDSLAPETIEALIYSVDSLDWREQVHATNYLTRGAGVEATAGMTMREALAYAVEVYRNARIDKR